MSLFAPPLTRLHTTRRSEPGDRDQVLQLALAVRERESAAMLAAFADLDGVRCDDGEVVHAWVATRGQQIVGVMIAIDRGGQIDLIDLVVAERDRRLGVGMSLLVELLEFADARRVPIIALVRGSDVAGLSWLCDRGFVPARFVGGRPAVVDCAFPGERCEEGIGLVRRGTSDIPVRIAT